MNKTRFLFAIILGMLLCSCSEDFNFEKGEGMKDLVFEQIKAKGYKIEDVNIKVSKTPIPPHTLVSNDALDLYSPDKPTWLYVVDLKPTHLFGHPHLYVFIDEQQDLTICDYEWPPSFNVEWNIVSQCKTTKSNDEFLQPLYFNGTNAINIDTSNFYATCWMN